MRDGDGHHDDTATLGDYLAASRAIRGCTCDPDVTIDGPAAGVLYAHIAHDEWCPALGGGG